jgi:predicted amidohydrolase
LDQEILKIAAAAYKMDWLESWSDYELKIERWVSDANADLLVFPEYFTMELASLAGRAIAADLEKSVAAVAAYETEIELLFKRMSKHHGCYILAGTSPVKVGRGYVNRAKIFAPSQMVAFQDKQIMTRFERESWCMSRGDGLRVFETEFGKFGVLVCYDSEFPLLACALVEKGADILLVPSCTDTKAGFNRVKIGAMARALEGQCIVVQAPTVGKVDWSPAVDVNHGAAAIYGPPDIGFPESGILALGKMDTPGWTSCDVDLAQVQTVRRDGHVLNTKHWEEQLPMPTVEVIPI